MRDHERHRPDITGSEDRLRYGRSEQLYSDEEIAEHDQRQSGENDSNQKENDYPENSFREFRIVSCGRGTHNQSMSVIKPL